MEWECLRFNIEYDAVAYSGSNSGANRESVLGQPLLRCFFMETTPHWI